MNADGGGQTPLVVGARDGFSSLMCPDWSPDGTRIAFTSSREGRFGEIYTMNPDGTGLVNLTRADSFDMDPSWQRLSEPLFSTPTPTRRASSSGRGT